MAEKEVYVDFSETEDEVIEEEVVQSGPTDDNTAPSHLDQFLSSLPPPVAEVLDKLQQSYQRYKKQYLVGAAVFLIVIAVIVVAALLFHQPGDDNSSGDPFSATKESFRAGPFLVSPLEPLVFTIENADRPEGNIAIHDITMTLVDKNNEEYPAYVLYGHHMAILDQDDSVIGITGASSTPALELNLPYVKSVAANDKWSVHVYLENIWGRASGADLEAFVNYDVVYSEYDAENYVQVSWDILGDEETGENVTTACKNYNRDDNTCKFVFNEEWEYDDATIVVANGFLNIGGINITLEDEGETIATTIPRYDKSGSFIVSFDTEFEKHLVKRGDKLRIISYYSAASNFRDVHSLFQIWGTFEAEPVFGEFSSSLDSSLSSTSYSYNTSTSLPNTPDSDSTYTPFPFSYDSYSVYTPPYSYDSGPNPTPS